MYDIVRPFLFAKDPERAHLHTLTLLDRLHRFGLSRLVAKAPPDLPTKAFGVDFPNPVGLAAGLDKNGAHIDALAALGFGFIEVGTVTPRPQPGNPQPRLFRLTDDKALINRLGFNNDGVDALVRHLEKTVTRKARLGVNIGKNKDTPNEQAEDDYLLCMDRVYPLADYITVNISSPNTAGLRELQEERALRRLVSRLRERQEALGARHGKRVPLLVKIAPDLTEPDVDAVARVLGELGVDGVIATNTTLARNGVDDPQAAEIGGLSGMPLRDRATSVLRMLRTRLPENIDLIGVGGIFYGSDAVQKTAAGAKLVQVYTGLVYRGPEVIGECVEAIRRRREHRSDHKYQA